MLADGRVWHGLPDGDWATWFASGIAFLAFVGLVAGLWLERRSRIDDIARLTRERREDQERAQALLIGGHIDWTSVRVTEPPANIYFVSGLQLTVVNASPLPIRRVIGHLVAPDGERAKPFPTAPVVTPGDHTATIRMQHDREYKLHLEFDDDAGISWLKYGDAEPLHKLTPEQRTP